LLDSLLQENKEDCTFAMDNDSEEMFSSQERRGGGLTESVAVTVPDQPIFDLAGLIDSALKKHITPLREEVKKLQKEVKDCNKKVSGLKGEVSLLTVAQKEMTLKLDKGKQAPGQLLTMEGLEIFKTRCFENLHLIASEEENDLVFNNLIQDLRENDCIIKDSAKCQADLKSRFNDERSTLKQQVVNRVHKDFISSTPETGSNLYQSKSYLSSHIGSLTQKSILVLHHLAYLHARYLNSKATLDTQDKAMRSKLVNGGLWARLSARVSKDSATVEEMKLRIMDALNGGFKPLKKEKRDP